MLKFSHLIRQCQIKGPRINCLGSLYDATVKRSFSESVKDVNDEIKKRFYEPEIQKLLKGLTRADFERVFRKRKPERKLKTPKYKFMTTAQVEEEMQKAAKRAEEKLQMPPVLPRRKEVNEVLSVDEELIGLDTTNSKLIFTDITFGKSDRNRVIVVREPDGTLRKANWDERHRMNQIYFPVEGRKLFSPKLFNPENVLNLCEKHEYEFLLDYACLQFEPDDPEYHRITAAVYDHIDETHNYELLRSTRHYGPLMFHIASQRNVDNLIIENIQTDRLEDAVWAINLFHLLRPDSKSSKTTYKPGNEIQFIKAFIELDSKKRGVLEMTLKSYIDTQENLPGIQKKAN